MPNLYGRSFTRSELMRRIGHLSQVAGVHVATAEEGPARGVRSVEFATGSGFRFTVGVERGFDVGRCEHRGRSVAWIPATALPGPWYFDQHDGFGWLRTALGGFNNTCGMVHIGNPETVAVPQYRFPARPVETYGVHDRAAMLPARLLAHGERWDGDACILEACGRVVQAQAYGENLVLERRYVARVGESRFTMHDVVTNEGWLPTQHMYLYHVNVGFPAVDEGSELVAPVVAPPVVPEGLPPVQEGSYTRFLAPQRDWTLQGFELQLAGDADGKVPVAVINAEGFGAYVIYDRRQFPTFLEWRMMGEGQYAVGIEPCTNTFGRDVAEERGELIVLGPGERRTYDTEFGVIDGPDEAAAFRSRVAAIIAGSRHS